MKKLSRLLPLFLATIALTAGCGAKETEQPSPQEDADFYIYYLDAKETQVVREAYKPAATTMEEQVTEYAEALRSKKPSNITYKRALPDYVTMKYSEDAENELLTLDFDRSYLELEGASEVLCRAAIVKTFCQVEGIEYVQFMVDGQPLKNSYDLPIGFMKAEDFIDNTGGEVKYEQNATVVLYFASAGGEKLVDTRVKIKYDGTIPLEQLVLNQLIKGPGSIGGVKEDEILRTVPEKTVLNKVTIKEGVCYVDVNREFLKGVEGVSAEATIYSVVNSLTEISDVSKVQFTIDGGQVDSLGEGTQLGAPLERNLDIVEKKK